MIHIFVLLSASPYMFHVQILVLVPIERSKLVLIPVAMLFVFDFSRCESVNFKVRLGMGCCKNFSLVARC